MFIKVAKGLYYQQFGLFAAEGIRASARLEPADRADAYRHADAVVTGQLTPSFRYSYLGDTDVTIWWFDLGRPHRGCNARAAVLADTTY